MRPGTPELPDSTDFVCGTLDEDRPLEVAYLSCMEQRKLAKQGVTPQDVDPSFPTSDPEQDDSDGNDVRNKDSESQSWVTGKPDESEDEQARGRPPVNRRLSTNSPSISPKRKESPILQARKPSPAPRSRKPSPQKRCKSPPPFPKRGQICRSPPPKRLFGQSPKRLPILLRRDPISPPCSRRPSYNEKTEAIPCLAQRPHLTHTTSLPRTPNPFWAQHRKHRSKAFVKGDAPNDIHSRGPIDIVQGLEKKRQRRKEKFWMTHTRNGSKEKDRRCQPGKGAQRMKEVGLEMADRCKGYGQRLQLVLSV